jgi:hypothetical protein
MKARNEWQERVGGGDDRRDGVGWGSGGWGYGDGRRAGRAERDRAAAVTEGKLGSSDPLSRGVERSRVTWDRGTILQWILIAGRSRVGRGCGRG